MRFENVRSKRVEFGAAYDCIAGKCRAKGCPGRPWDDGRSHGRHGVEIRWYLGNSVEGIVQFVIYTNWMLPETWEDPTYPSLELMKPIAADLGYHSPKSLYKEHYRSDFCHLLSQRFCFYDGSGLNAEPVMERLFREGGDAVWEELERYWATVFGETDD